MWKFSTKKGQTNNAHYLYSYVWLCTLVHTYPILFKCGVFASFIFFRFFHNPLSDKRNQFHTFFYFNICAILELYGFG